MNKKEVIEMVMDVCENICPENKRLFQQHLDEKLSGYKDRGENQKSGMVKQVSSGKHVSRVPFGYKWDFNSKQIIPAENFQEVEEIFEEFLEPQTSLTKVAKKHNLSVNGLKKILKNFAYVGKIKFDGQIHQGKHKPIVSSTLFNHVQNKLDKISKK